MNRVCADNEASTPGFLATVWPASVPTDTELQRRRKVIVRSAQVAVAVMIAAGVGGALLVDYKFFTANRIALLILVSGAYAVWSLHGMRDTIRRLLAEREPAAASPAMDRQRIFYFLVQLGLGALVYTLSNGIRGGSLAWLVLLPPVAHSAILLSRSGIALVSVASVCIFVANVAARQGWSYAGSASVAFSFAVCFTLIFTLLAVSAERSRAKVQTLADELSDANRKLREYAVAAEELAATRERNRLAREIHDSLGHYLTVVNVQIEAARAMQPHDEARARDALTKAQSLTQEGLREIRRSVSALRASPLENKSVPAALADIVAESRAAGVNAHLEISGVPRSLSPAAELTLYRAAQEGLTNVRKHASCSRATLTLNFSSPAAVRLTVCDDGAGVAGNPGRGFGLMGLQERAQLVGGQLRSQSTAGHGFTLEVEVPG